MSPLNPPSNNSSLEDEFHYAFAEIESIIHEDVPTFIRIRRPLDEELLSGVKEEIEAVVESIKSDLDTVPFHFHDEKARADYIQFHQRALLRLAGSLVRYMQPSPEIEGVKAETLIQFIYQVLNDLLRFIKKHFVKYFSDTWVPHNYQQTVCINIKPRVQLLREKLQVTGIDPELMAIILSPLEELLASNVKDYSFNEILYLKEYKYRILEFLDHKSDDVEECLLLLLYQLDFNSDEFYNYSIKRFSKMIYESGSEVECLENLLMIQKLLRQTTQNPFISFRADHPSLQNRINTWLNEEIRYYEARQKMNSDVQLSGSNVSAIRSSLTVAEIAYVVRIFVKFDILRVKRQLTKIFKFISLYIDTENTSSISVHSLNNQYHKPDAKARENIKALLVKIINYIDKDQESSDA